MRQALQRAWLGRGLLAWALLPISGLYAAAAALHRSLYRLGLLKRTSLPVPVIVVGNVVTGGAGKTPVIIAVARHLAQRGLRPGVISRGYGRHSAAVATVETASDAKLVGDEPLLIRRQCDCPVVVGSSRADAGRALLAAHPDVDVILCDDGLQHHALARDIEICVFDERGIGNGWLLPAGPLREAWPRQADLVLRPASTSNAIASTPAAYDIERSLAAEAIRGDGARRALERISGPVHAVAGIAQPDAFFGMLRSRGLPLARCTALADHDDFSRFRPDASDVLVCTEKDAVKLWRQRPDAWAVPLAIRIEGAFWAALDRLLDAKGLSSRHGSETARTAGLPRDEGPPGA